MIPDSAHSKNQAKRVDLAAKGYQISIGHDGWSIILHGDVVARGYPERGLTGEAMRRQCLDVAVLQADQMYKATLPPDPEPAKAEKAPKEEKPEPKAPSAQRAAVTRAVGFLKLAGAKYHIEFEDEVFTNIEIKRKTEPRQNAGAVYRPMFDQYKDQSEFTFVLPVPDDMDFAKFDSALRAYGKSRFGDGCLISGDAVKRVFEVLVSKGE